MKTLRFVSVTLVLLILNTVQGAAPVSALKAILDDATHRSQVHWVDSDLRRLHLWLDANVSFYGTYDLEFQLVQRKGRSVPLPVMQ